MQPYHIRSRRRRVEPAECAGPQADNAPASLRCHVTLICRSCMRCLRHCVCSHYVNTEQLNEPLDDDGSTSRTPCWQFWP